MKKSELSLYPKVSPIYNKILQLAIAIMLIVILLNLWLFSQHQQKVVIEQYIDEISQTYLAQAASSVEVLMLNKEKKALEALIEKLSAEALVNDVHLYDHTGQLMISSSGAKNIREFYQQASNGSHVASNYAPFVKELRDSKLIGYLRMTLDQKQLAQPLLIANHNNYELMRLMTLFALIIGFFLTRGFNRFSRQGFRIRHNHLQQHK